MVEHGFALEKFEDGGVLLDVESGLLFRLNRTATTIWDGTLGGRDPESIASDLSLAHSLPMATARQDVSATLNIPSEQQLLALRGPPIVTEWHYESTPAGYLFSWNGRSAMQVEATSESIRVSPSLPASEYGVCLRAIAPKLVARAGFSVMHASAVSASDQTVIAFMGVNGAGKTTTARTFLGDGFELVCEDKLVAQINGEHVEAILDAEPTINRWIRETRHNLDARPDLPSDVKPLASCSVGPSLPIARVFLVDSSRRAGNTIGLTRLPQSEAASQIFQHCFYGSELVPDWRRHLACVASLARTAQIFIATMPEGLAELATAVRRYKESTAS